MAEIEIDPVADTRNEGWTFGGLLSTLFESFLRAVGDDEYAAAPASKGRAAVSFPVDVSSIPTGAVITSVKINIRCKKASGNYSVTCNLMSSDDMSKFTSRTLYPTTSFADYEIGSYTVDPLGYKWDIERLNKLVVQVFTYAGVNGAIQVSGVWATVNYRQRPNITVLGPTGNLATASPTLDWTYSQAEGDVQAKAEYKIFEATQVTQASFNPNKSTPITSGTVRGDKTVLVLPTTLDTGSYYAYIRSFSSAGAVSAWGSKSFSIEAPHPGVPTISLAGDGAESKVTLTMQDTSNLLSAVQADAEVSADKDEYLATNCTFDRSSLQVFGTGTASYSLTATSTSDMSITSDFFQIAPNKDVTIRAQTFAGDPGDPGTQTARTNSLTLTFYDSDFVTTGTPITVTGTDSTTDWVELVANGTTPAGAVHAKLTYQVDSPASGEIHYVDHLGVMYGTDSPWTPGGHTSRNLADSDLGGSPADWGFTGAPGTVTALKSNESRTGASGQRCLNLTRVNPATSISYVGAGNLTSYTSSGSSVTIDNINPGSPGTLAAGDLMIAYIVTDRLGTITGLPTGWTAVDTAQVHDVTSDFSLHVIAKMAGGEDVGASNYTCTFDLPFTRASTRMVAYRGAAAVESNFNPSGTSTNTTNTAFTLKSATLNNTTTNAWRLSAFAAIDEQAGHGTTGSWNAALYGSGGVTSNISYVGVGTAWSEVTYANPPSVRWYKPSGVQPNDIMIAQISWWETAPAAGPSPGLTVPSGWNLAAYNKSATGANANGITPAAECCTAILWRKATSSDNSVTSYTTNLTGTNPQVHGAKKMRMAMCVAYRGVDGTNPFIAHGINGLGAGDGTSSYINVPGAGSPAINNNNSKAWSVTMYAVHGFNDAATGTGGWRQTPTQPQRYFLPRVDDGFIQDGHSIACFDSNGVINTGSVSRTGIIPGDTDQASHPIDGANAWLAVLKPATTPYVAGPSQTRRIDNSTGTGTLYLNWSAFDSNATIPSGSQAVLGTYTPESGAQLKSSVSWHGILIPATPAVDGLLQADMNNYIDISNVSPEVLTSAGNKMTLGAAFIAKTGTSGTPLLSLKFYRATELLEDPILEGSGFGDDKWVYTARSFDIPEGTTRIKASFAIPDRVNGDEVDIDRITLAFGDDVNIWKNGTTLGLHPIWNSPLIEYQDNDGTGWTEWKPLSGRSFNPPVFDYLTGECTFEDHTIIPLTARRYRVKAYTYGLRGDSTASTPSQASDAITVTATHWWLKDLQNPENSMLLPVRSEEISITTTNTASAFQPLGEDYSLVITEGYKSSQIELPLIAQRTDWAAFRKLVRSGKTLYLQSDIDDAFWVRPISDINAETLVSAQRQSDPYRTVKVTFLQTAPEA